MELASRSQLNAHVCLTGALVLVAVGLSFLLWFLPSARYGRDGQLCGIDLRLATIQLLWWQTLLFIATSTIAIVALPLQPRVRYAIGYGAAVVACLASATVLGRLF